MTIIPRFKLVHDQNRIVLQLYNIEIHIMVSLSNNGLDTQTLRIYPSITVAAVSFFFKLMDV